jgi:hypothetical protein
MIEELENGMFGVHMVDDNGNIRQVGFVKK